MTGSGAVKQDNPSFRVLSLWLGNQLELELKQEREKRLQNNWSLPGKASQRLEPKTDERHKIQEENVKIKKPLEERLQSYPTDEQDSTRPVIPVTGSPS